MFEHFRIFGEISQGKKTHENGILGIPMSIHRHGLAIETIEKFINFHESDKISRSYPGKKDCVTVREKGSKVKVQKRLLLCNLEFI